MLSPKEEQLQPLFVGPSLGDGFSPSPACGGVSVAFSEWTGSVFKKIPVPNGPVGEAAKGDRGA